MDKKHIPNLLTFFRVAAVLAMIVLASVFPWYKLAFFMLFVAAAITDFFDGWLARKWNAVTAFGTMLDPIADKLLVAVALVYLVEYTPVPLMPVLVILGREIYVAGMREFLALRSLALPVSKGGKWKTAVQMLALVTLLVSINFEVIEAWNIGILLLWVATLLAIVSAVAYTRHAIRIVRTA